MATDHRAELARIHRFDQLIRYLRDEMGWPIASDDFEELTFDYTAEELGINAESAAKIQEIKRLRPLSAQQPWGIFFVKFEPKNLPVVALRRILSQVALKKRASANAVDRAGWAADDLLFVSNYGQDGERKISFAHFARPSSRDDLPTLKVLGWDNQDTPLHLDAIAKELTENLAWPQDENDADAWRQRWRSAFTLGHREVITTAERLSIRLAELAGAIRDRIRSAIAIESPRGPLTRLMRAFRESLVHDLDAEGFADMYAQTISYGLLSSRIADPTKKTADDFAAHMRTSPFLRELMQTFLKVGGRMSKSDSAGIDFDELGVADVVELLDGANMEAVLRDFGDRNRQEDPVIHFFEGFLQAYDRRIRKDRGVFYTPQPVVSYIVRSVHELLQTEFGLADGLADTTTWGEMQKKHPGLKLPPLTDSPQETRTISPEEPFVQILDPATGTATFLVEAIDVIYRTLEAKWKAQRLTGAEQREMWNDYVPKHLLPRLHAYELMMAPYAIAHMKIGLKLAETGYRFSSDERARIYLTNALEPWVKQLPLIGFDALAHEAEAVNEIKRSKRFSVVLGNPPYSGISSNMNNWIDRLLHGQDLSGRSNGNYYSVDGVPLSERKLWLQDDYVKFIRLSQRILDISHAGVFGFITNNSYLDGPTHRGMRYALSDDFSQILIVDLHGSVKRHKDSSDFDTDENVFDIQQGVSILVAAKGINSQGGSCLKHSELRGNRQQKYEKLGSMQIGPQSTLIPSPPWYLFVPTRKSGVDEYANYFSIKEMFSIKSTSVQTSRDAFAIDFDAVVLEQRIALLASEKTNDDIRVTFGLKDGRNWSLDDARQDIKKNKDWRDSIRPYLYRAFDIRYIAYRDSLINWPRHDVMDHLNKNNLAILVPRQLAGGEHRHAFCSRLICDMCVVSTATKEAVQTFPLFLTQHRLPGQLSLTENPATNFTDVFLATLEQHGIFCKSKKEAEQIFAYIYGILYSRSYRDRYSEFLSIDFPRIPFPKNGDIFFALASLGQELISLHLFESKQLSESNNSFVGSQTQEIQTISWVSDTVWIDKAQTTGFSGVSSDIWNFHVGGYQVCEKWLKDRKGRTLSKDDIEHYQKIIAALSETNRLMNQIDFVIEKYGGWPDAFSTN